MKSFEIKREEALKNAKTKNVVTKEAQNLKNIVWQFFFKIIEKFIEW